MEHNTTHSNSHRGLMTIGAVALLLVGLLGGYFIGKRSEASSSPSATSSLGTEGEGVTALDEEELGGKAAGGESEVPSQPAQAERTMASAGIQSRGIPGTSE